MRIFLSGAIEGVGDLANGWRQEAVSKLGAKGYDVVSPLVNAEQQVFQTPNEIVHRNHMLQKTCDMILVEYMIPNRCYIGTDMELVRAHDWHQPIIVFANDMYKDRVYMQYLATAILPSLEAAMSYIQLYYPPFDK